MLSRLISLFIAVPLTFAATVNYTYDSAGRMIKADYGSAGVITYTYDKAGNLLSRVVAGATTGNGPNITLVANAFGDTPLIAPNTWVEIKGTNLTPAASNRIWADPDFVNPPRSVFADPPDLALLDRAQ